MTPTCQRWRQSSAISGDFYGCVMNSMDQYVSAFAAISDGRLEAQQIPPQLEAVGPAVSFRKSGQNHFCSGLDIGSDLGKSARRFVRCGIHLRAEYCL